MAFPLFAVVVAAHAVCLLAVLGVRTLPALKGEVPGRPIILGSYLLKVAATAVALSLSVNLAVLLGQSSHLAQAEGHLRGLGDASALTLGHAYSNVQQDRLGTVVSPWIRKLDARGAVLYAYERPPVSLPGHTKTVGILFVNESYASGHLPAALELGGAAKLRVRIPRVA